MDTPTESHGGDVVAQDGSRNWAELSPELLTMIMSHLDPDHRLNLVQKVCSSWRKACRDPYLWRCIDLTDEWDDDDETYMERYCKMRVDLSCGGLVSLSLEQFASDELLDYIADKSIQLKTLRLMNCEFSHQAISATVQKFIFLEELEISYCSISKDGLIAAGRNCHFLRSLKLNQTGFRHPLVEDDSEANAIAENMSGLHHLQIFGNKLTNHGLLAILDRCRHLESLDLRQCFNLKMEGDLENRCREQIKDLRCPEDSVDDYPYDAELSDYGSSDDDYPSGYYGYESPTYDGYDGYSDMLADFEFPNADYELSLDHGMLPGTYHEFQADSDLSDPEF
ncbi:F-box protein SKIP19 [Linum perenne]